ncbi:hypothetical protein RUND412_003694 [Rhizina undulata]
MAPRPFETTIKIRNTSTPSYIQIYAISSGPQKGVHMLSPSPLPASEQYLYRHPINLHKTHLTIIHNAPFRRFTSLPSAMSWLDDQDRQRRLSETAALDSVSGQLSSISLATASSSADSTSSTSSTDPVYAALPSSISSSLAADSRREDVLKGMARRDPGRIGKRRGGMSMNHLGVRRRELLHNLFEGGGTDASGGRIVGDSINGRVEVTVVRRMVSPEQQRQDEEVMEIEEL